MDFQPYSRDFAADPYPVYAQLRRESPIFWSEDFELTFFTRYDDITRLLADSRLGRSMDDLRSRAAHEVSRSRDAWSDLPNYSRFVRTNLLEMEGEGHARLRRILAEYITPARIRGLRERIEALVNELLDAVISQRNMDFVRDFAVPLPVFVISELLGWPPEERHRLRPWSADIVRLYEKDSTPEHEAQAEMATAEFADRLRTLIAERRSEPREDLISALAARVDEVHGLEEDQLIATCILLLNAGHESTVNAAGNGMLALLRNPDQLARLSADGSLIETAVEEILRYDSPLHFFHRFVLEDMRYGDREFKQGDMLGLLYGSANRDAEAFERADEFDVGRHPNPHIAFGKGRHFCLGAPLARLELQLLFQTLLERIPGITLAGQTPRYNTGLVFRGLKELHVSW